MCPHCKNKDGFVFGTCIECGFNYISEKFTTIKVSIEDLEYLLSTRDVEFLIWKHAGYTENMYDFNSKG